MFGSIFFDPAGMGDTLATLDDTDLFGVRGEPLGLLVRRPQAFQLQLVVALLKGTVAS